MVKNNILFLFVLAIGTFFLPKFVNAECNNEKLTKIAENIQVKYEHIGKNEYKVTFYNLPSEITITTNNFVFYSSDGTLVSNTEEGFIGGTAYKFFYMSNANSECGINEIFSKYIDIPMYNVYSEKEMCSKKEYKEFDLCKSNYPKRFTEEEFEQELKKFEKNKDKKNPILNVLNSVIKFIFKYVYIFVGALLLTITTIVIVVIKKRKKIKF